MDFSQTSMITMQCNLTNFQEGFKRAHPAMTMYFSSLPASGAKAKVAEAIKAIVSSRQAIVSHDMMSEVFLLLQASAWSEITSDRGRILLVSLSQ